METYLNIESPFLFEELFFSRTNTKGIIQAGNSVFQRVSKYEWADILRKPHNIIRHPSMPRGVFQLLWDTILIGKPLGAYVVNKAKDGSYYWVFAIVAPVDDGFLSIRLKPSSPIFEIVKKKYADLLEIERKEKITPKASLEILLKEVQKFNFTDYNDFMNEALAQELEYRQIQLGLEPSQIVLQLKEMLKLGVNLKKQCQDIFSAYRQSAFVPLNLEVQAARIGQDGAPIAVVSSQYEKIAKQIQEETTKFLAAGNLVQQKVSSCQFDVCNSLLQKEMCSFFENEPKDIPVDTVFEMNLLNNLASKGVNQAKTSLIEIDTEFNRFKTLLEEVKKLATSLEIVSVTGKIEVAKIKQSSNDLVGLLNNLATFKSALKSCLNEIDSIGQNLVGMTTKLKADLS